MFTGIIEEIGTIRSLNKKEQGAVISIQCKTVLDDLKLGDSVSINGACQTVTKSGSDFFEVDAALETLKLTNLGELKNNDKVNLERAMVVGSRFGGHIVSGHIEGIGKFLKKEQQGMAQVLYFEAPKNISIYMVYKGSITINGVSLTIASLDNNIFSVSIIPHTLKETNLNEINSGEIVNLEPDIIAKYVEKFVTKADNTTKDISMDFLKENGFY